MIWFRKHWEVELMAQEAAAAGGNSFQRDEGGRGEDWRKRRSSAIREWSWNKGPEVRNTFWKRNWCMIIHLKSCLAQPETWLKRPNENVLIDGEWLAGHRWLHQSYYNQNQSKYNNSVKGKSAGCTVRTTVCWRGCTTVVVCLLLIWIQSLFTLLYQPERTDESWNYLYNNILHECSLPLILPAPAWNRWDLVSRPTGFWGRKRAVPLHLWPVAPS